MPKKPKKDEKTANKRMFSIAALFQSLRNRRLLLGALGIILLLGISIGAYFYTQRSSPPSGTPDSTDLGSFEANYDAAQLALSEEKMQDALAHYEAALNHAPDEEKIALLNEIASLALSLGEFDKAIDYFGQLASSTDGDTKTNAEFYLELAKEQKQAREALESEDYDETPPPEVSEIYEEL